MMGKKVRVLSRRLDGTPIPYAGMLIFVVDAIREASAQGKGLRLTAEEVRALDWSVIRLEGQTEPDNFRECSFEEFMEEPQP